MVLTNVHNPWFGDKKFRSRAVALCLARRRSRTPKSIRRLEKETHTHTHTLRLQVLLTGLSNARARSSPVYVRLTLQVEVSLTLEHKSWQSCNCPEDVKVTYLAFYSSIPVASTVALNQKPYCSKVHSCATDPAFNKQTKKHVFPCQSPTHC